MAETRRIRLAIRPKVRAAWPRAQTVFMSLAVVIFATGLASAETLTLDEAVDQALRNNPDFLATRQQLRVGEARLVKARYWNAFNPVVQVGAAQWHSPQTGSVAEPAVNASIEVEVAGQPGKRIKEAEDNLVKVRAQVADAQRTLTAQVKSSFYQVLYVKRRLELFRRIEDLNRRLRDASQARFKTGEGTRMEANLEEIRYDQSRRDTLVGRRDYQNGLRELRRVVGIDADVPLDLNGSLSVRPASIDAATLLDVAFANRPDLKAGNAEIKRVEAETALTKRLIVPNPVISGTYSLEPSAPGSNFRIVGGAVGISIPLFDRKQAELTALAGDRMRATYNRRAVLLNIGTQVRDAVAGYDAAAEAVQIYESDMVSRVEQNFGFIETAYRAGKINLLQLVVVQNDLVRADLSYLDALREYWVARTNLEFAIGTDLNKAVRP